MLPDVLDILSRFISIDSRNTCPLDRAGERVATEEAMGRAVGGLMVQMGMAVTYQDIAPGRPNVIGFHGCGKAGAPTLGFNAHTDTVGTDGMVIPPFAPVIKDGLIYGRGSCDTKGSLAAMLKACDLIIQEDLELNLLMVASAAEETGNEGAPLLELSQWHCDGFIVGEPTSNRPVVFHKGLCQFELVCRGRAAHGSRPELGDNAIFKAARLVTFLQEKMVPAIGAITSPDFSSGCTLSPGIIAGGTRANMVPERCGVTCDMRLVPEAGNAQDVIQRIVRAASDALGFPVELGWNQCVPPMATPAPHPFVRTVCQAVRQEGLDATPQDVAYCTDGGVLSRMGYPCVVLGPGDIAVAHSALEYSPVAEIRQAVEIYRKAARLHASRTQEAR